LGKFEEAYEVCQQALRIDSKLSQGHRTLGEISTKLGSISEAIRFYQEALTLDPTDVQVHASLALLLQQQSRPEDAVQILNQGLRLAPDHLDMANNLAWLLATSPIDDLRDGAESLRLAQRVCIVTGEQDANFLDTLAAAWAEVGNFNEAVKVIERAVELARTAGNEELAIVLSKRLRLYKSQQPFRDDHKP
jgi:tetratricopeptide (TPR) repeat protein